MRKKTGFPSLFRAPPSLSPSSSYGAPYAAAWPWPSCKHPRTRSFRARGRPRDDDVFKTVNSVYLDTTESWFTNSSDDLAPSDGRFSTASEEEEEEDCGRAGEPSSEAVIRSLRSDRDGGTARLFFEPGATTGSIMEQAKPGGHFPFKEGTVMEIVESDDPFKDFRLSMEEMVAAHGVRDWNRLEELLQCYLRLNDKATYSFIVDAFVDILLELFFSRPSSSSSSCSSSRSILSDDLKRRREKRFVGTGTC